MPSPTWDEYLAAASAHLRAARQTAEHGAPPPPPPHRPGVPMGAEHQDPARRLALGYHLLAEELVARLTVIEQRRPSSTRLTAQSEPRAPRYIDTPA